MSGEVGQPDQTVQVLDASGLSCPLPLLKAKQALNRLNSGERLRVIATDAGSVRDFKAFTDQSGDKLLESLEQDGSFIYLIQKA
ncbi:sulfurtransferase TusA family protein [Motiliproteus coralliicola]|uniref:Sulfurtransferase TusA family protein n=1 Tax=Motiliproteus coralliicola TaxID=2283196 RepID=A0A369WQA7_9GAMM|nr:sulfurtransferase TusA family protein [Motiliproteus coralliicola]RDE24260.1 sulfurtransferase TusA family protein [Motiliproteus coralliicola]